MVNPERLDNALAALDILARADATAFASAGKPVARMDNARGDAAMPLKAGDYVRHELSGRVGKVIETGGSRALVRWNADGTETPAKVSDLARMDNARGDAG